VFLEDIEWIRGQESPNCTAWAAAIGCVENWNVLEQKTRSLAVPLRSSLQVYDLTQNYAGVRWTYYILQSDGTYKQQSESIFNNVVSGGATPPYFPCGLPQN
jgi:hypothetical protein